MPEGRVRQDDAGAGPSRSEPSERNSIPASQTTSGFNDPGRWMRPRGNEIRTVLAADDLAFPPSAAGWVWCASLQLSVEGRHSRKSKRLSSPLCLLEFTGKKYRSEKKIVSIEGSPITAFAGLEERRTGQPSADVHDVC